MTRKEILAVTPEDKQGQEQINQIIAEFMGLCWHKWEMANYHPFPERYPDLQSKRLECLKCKIHPRIKHLKNAPKNPDYCQSLDLIHKVEEQIGNDLDHGYVHQLGLTTAADVYSMTPQIYWQIAHATALEKAKAAALTIQEMKK